MDQVTRAKTQFRLGQWKKLILDCQASGTSVCSWCKLNNISVASYYYYLKRIRLQAIENLPVPVSKEKRVAFKKLEVQTPATDTQSAIIIRLPSATIEVRNGTSQQTIEAVLFALKSTC
jgi:hypothetical protein